MRTIITVQPIYSLTPDKSPGQDFPEKASRFSQTASSRDSRIQQILRSWGSTTATATVLLVFVLTGFGSAMLLASTFPAVSLLIAATMTAVLIAAIMTRPQTSKL